MDAEVGLLEALFEGIDQLQVVGGAAALLGSIAADGEARKSEDLVCSDNRGGDAKIIIVEGDGQRKDKNLAILKVPVRNNSKFNDDIKLDAILNRDIILKVMARSLMVNVEHKRPEDEFTVQKSTEIHQLCFGLDFKTVK